MHHLGSSDVVIHHLETRLVPLLTATSVTDVRDVTDLLIHQRPHVSKVKIKVTLDLIIQLRDLYYSWCMGTLAVICQEPVWIMNWRHCPSMKTSIMKGFHELYFVMMAMYRINGLCSEKYKADKPEIRHYKFVERMACEQPPFMATIENIFLSPVSGLKNFVSSSTSCA